MLEGITWLGHASFRIEDQGKVIYLDPWKLETTQKADLVLATHGHRDHLSLEDLALIVGPETVLVCPPDCVAQARESLGCEVEEAKPGDSLLVRGYPIEAVYSYNTNKPNHPRDDNHVGYVITVGGRRIYHAGDTDVIPEMSAVRCDVALLPVGGTYTMNAREAAAALAVIRPKVAVPMHWGDIVGCRADAQRFADNAPEGVEVVILTPDA